MRTIVFGSVILSALALGACEDKPSGGATPGTSATPAPSAATSTTAATPSASAQPAAPEKKKVEAPKDHKARFKALEDAYSAHDAKKVSELFAENGVMTRPGRDDIKGRAEIEKRVAKNFEVFKDMKITLGRVWEKDKHTAFAEWVGTGTNSGEWPEIGIPKATNKAFGVVGASWIEVDDDGFIKEENSFLDGPTMLGQLMPKAEMPARAVITAAPEGTEHFEPLAAKEAKDDKAKAELAKALEAEKKHLEAEEKLLAAFNSDKPNKIDEGLKLFADDFVNVDYTQEKNQKGKGEFKALVGKYFLAFPDLRIKSTTSFPMGKYVVSKFEYTGTQKGAFGPIKATNKPISLHQVEVDEFNNDGKLVKSWTWGNNEELLKELGVTPAQEKKDEVKEEKREEKREEKKEKKK